MDLLTQTIQVFQEGVQLCSPMGPDNEGCLSAVIGAVCSKSSIKSPTTAGDRDETIAVPSVCS